LTARKAPSLSLSLPPSVSFLPMFCILMALINTDYLVMFGIFSEALLHCTEGFQAVRTFLFLFTVQEALVPAP
jgi:hypothetical protein